MKASLFSVLLWPSSSKELRFLDWESGVNLLAFVLFCFIWFCVGFCFFFLFANGENEREGGRESVRAHMCVFSVCVCVCVWVWVWCGVVWCGVVLCGVVLCCVVLCCVVVWCGVVWCGVVWCGVVWCVCVCMSERGREGAG